MRMLMTVQMDTEAASRGIKDGSMAKAIDSTLQQLQPEAAYFSALDGQRTGIHCLRSARAGADTTGG